MSFEIIKLISISGAMCKGLTRPLIVILNNNCSVKVNADLYSKNTFRVEFFTKYFYINFPFTIDNTIVGDLEKIDFNAKELNNILSRFV